MKRKKYSASQYITGMINYNKNNLQSLNMSNKNKFDKKITIIQASHLSKNAIFNILLNQKGSK